jgi:hypothetical protein
VLAVAVMAAKSTRCAAAHQEDRSSCSGAAEAVVVVFASDERVSGCVRHGAAMLASIIGGRVYPGPAAVGGEAIEAFNLAQGQAPFEFMRAGELR